VSIVHRVGVSKTKTLFAKQSVCSVSATDLKKKFQKPCFANFVFEKNVVYRYH